MKITSVPQKTSFCCCFVCKPKWAKWVSWLGLAYSIQRGSERFWVQFGGLVKRETGFDLEDANSKVNEFVGPVRGAMKRGEDGLDRFRTELLPEFVNWNRWERWKASELREGGDLEIRFISSWNVALSLKRLW
ncbi:ATP-dependent zinc metalloprotease FTSH 12, chloroplastic [Vitis vinifera]|uniref:ATP-dependent zinc metalloprotease FTSH 12, chloroplastic n=1 Tax=Vitis vinifera TaxID=29760 RepID=A0A438CQZ1_VITVI|nr:ATP-dependent zinc metalloprotease FTSH 12, chloroplastic [Vitis vinifera]